MKRKVLIITNIILAVMLALFAVGYTYAWFAEYYKTDIKLYADPDTGYFASGSGTSTDPYIIHTYRHLYNLAWLQNTGKFSTTTTYFELDTDIDMSSTYFVIPPIGNDKYPFSGSFDGNGHTISGLIVSTDKTKLTNFPNESASSYAFSNYVGLFGNTGSGSVITNFILDNPIVEVSSTNTTYSSSGSESCVGLAIGYVAGKASSIGVIGGILAVQKTGYTTYNSILGTISESLGTSVTGGTTTVGTGMSGIGTSFGGSVDIRSLMYRMYYMSTNKWTSPSLTFNGLTSSSSSYPNSGSYMSLVVSNNVEEDSGAYYSSNTSEEVSEYNIGYYTGNQAKILGKLTYEQLLASDCYTADGLASDLSGGSTSGGNVSSTLIGSLTDVNIYEFTYDDGTTSLGISENITDDVKSDVLDLLNQQYVYTITFDGQVEVNNWVTITDAVIAGETYSKINVPPKTLWFTPQEDGMVKVVYLTMNDCLRDISLYQISRSDQGTENSFYSTSTGAITITEISSVYEYTDEEGNTAYEYNNNNHDGTKIYQTQVWNGGANGDLVIYLEIPVYAGKEYAFGAVNSQEAYVLYMDIGQNGVSIKSDGKYTSDYDVSAIDFIYSGVTIYGSNFVILNSGADSSSTTLVEGDDYEYYVPTDTRIGLTSVSTGTTAVLIIAYTRESDGTEEINSVSYTIRVTYYTTGTDDVPTQSSTGAYIPDSSASSDSTYFTNYNDMVNSFE